MYAPRQRGVCVSAGGLAITGGLANIVIEDTYVTLCYSTRGGGFAADEGAQLKLVRSTVLRCFGSESVTLLPCQTLMLGVEWHDSHAAH